MKHFWCFPIPSDLTIDVLELASLSSGEVSPTLYFLLYLGTVPIVTYD